MKLERNMVWFMFYFCLTHSFASGRQMVEKKKEESLFSVSAHLQTCLPILSSASQHFSTLAHISQEQLAPALTLPNSKLIYVHAETLIEDIRFNLALPLNGQLMRSQGTRNIDRYQLGKKWLFFIIVVTGRVDLKVECSTKFISQTTTTSSG